MDIIYLHCYHYIVHDDNPSFFEISVCTMYFATIKDK